jgi:hypothetical protein
MRFSSRVLSVSFGLAVCGYAAGMWSGAWRLVPSPSPGIYGNELRSVAVAEANDFWAVGYLATYYGTDTLIQHWTGKQWEPVTSPNASAYSTYGYGNVLNGVSANGPSDAWAVGYTYSSSDYRLQPMSLHWNGFQWLNVVPSSSTSWGNSMLNSAKTFAANDAWAVGYFEDYDGYIRPLVERWDGARWTQLLVPQPQGATAAVLSGVDGASPDDVWAVGHYYDYDHRRFLSYVLHWNGTEWSRISSPDPSHSENILNGVASISAKSVWAVGYYYADGEGPETLVQHWDGVRWSVVETPNWAVGYGTDNVLRSIAVVSENDIWAVGMFENQNTDIHQHRPLAIHWNGKRWTLAALTSPGISSELNGVAAVPGEQVAAVGLFSRYPINIYDGTYTVPETMVQMNP